VGGFNLAYAVTPKTFADFVDLVVPELQKHGRYKLDYAPGTLREKALWSRSRAARCGSSSGEVPRPCRSAWQPIRRSEPQVRCGCAAGDHLPIR
jgi:hypothetical protein